MLPRLRRSWPLDRSKNPTSSPLGRWIFTACFTSLFLSHVHDWWANPSVGLLSVGRVWSRKGAIGCSGGTPIGQGRTNPSPQSTFATPVPSSSSSLVRRRTRSLLLARHHDLRPRGLAAACCSSTTVVVLALVFLRSSLDRGHHRWRLVPDRGQPGGLHPQRLPHPGARPPADLRALAPRPRRRRRRAIPHARRPGGGHEPAAVPARRRRRRARARAGDQQLLPRPERLHRPRRPARLPVELWPANRAAPPVCDPGRIFAAVAVAGLTRRVYSLFTSPAIEMHENARGQPIDPHLRCAREDFCTAVFLRLDERHLPRE